MMTWNGFQLSNFIFVRKMECSKCSEWGCLKDDFQLKELYSLSSCNLSRVIATFAPGGSSFAIVANPLTQVLGRKVLRAHQTFALFYDRRPLGFGFACRRFFGSHGDSSLPMDYF